MKKLLYLLVVLALVGCTGTPTVVPPTETLQPPTETLQSPTDTLEPPTVTTIPPTKTTVPPTITKTISPPTATRTATKTPPPTVTKAPTKPPTGGIFWAGDGETGDLSQWCKQTSETPDRVTVVTDPVHQGKFAYRFELHADDNPSGERATLANGQCAKDNRWIEEGTEEWYGFSIYLPLDYPKYEQWSLTVQWKGEHTGSPPAQCSLRNDHWQFVYRPNFGSNTVRWVSPQPVRRGQWEHFVLHAKWSADPEVGFFEYYYNGELVVPKFNTATMHTIQGNTIHNFVAIGLYRDQSINFVEPTVLFHDNFTAGNSLEAVAPWLREVQ